MKDQLRANNIVIRPTKHVSKTKSPLETYQSIKSHRTFGTAKNLIEKELKQRSKGN